MKCSKTQQSEETKKIIAKAKKDITNGADYKEVLAQVREQITDSIQREKATQSIINWL